MSGTFGIAWIAFALAVAVHVADEALHGFLPVYNRSVAVIRRRVPVLPIPTFTFPVWLGLLTAGVVLLLALSPFALHGAPWLKVAAIPLGLVAGVLNAAGHLGSSAWLRRPMPGVYSAGLLLACGAWLVVAAH